MMFDDYQWKLLKVQLPWPRYRCVSVVLSVALRSSTSGLSVLLSQSLHAPPAAGPLTSTCHGSMLRLQRSPHLTPGDWMRCFEVYHIKCKLSSTHAGAIPEHLSAWLVTNKNSGTTIVPCAATVSGPKLEPQQGTPSEAPTASAAAGLTQASQPKSSRRRHALSYAS